MADDSTTAEATKSDLVIERTPEYLERYANNVRFESSVWDVKVSFGTLDQSTSPFAVRLHTGMHIPWLQVKLMLYYLFIQLQFHESDNGRVMVPIRVQPTRPSEAMASLADLPAGKELIDRATEAWTVLFGSPDDVQT